MKRYLWLLAIVPFALAAECEPKDDTADDSGGSGDCWYDGALQINTLDYSCTTGTTDQWYYYAKTDGLAGLVDLEYDDLLRSPGRLGSARQRLLVGEGVDGAGLAGVRAPRNRHLDTIVRWQLPQVVRAQYVASDAKRVRFFHRGCLLHIHRTLARLRPKSDNNGLFCSLYANIPGE